MDVLAEKLDIKLRNWKPDIARQVKQSKVKLIDLADQEAIDMMRSRSVEQDVLDILDEP